MRCFHLFLSAAVCSAAELPEMYSRVDRLLWVVDDVGRTVAGWKDLGIATDATPVRDDAKLNIRFASAQFGDIGADFVQPLAATGTFADFLKRRRAGVIAVAHRPPSRDAMQTEIARLKALGVGVLLQARS